MPHIQDLLKGSNQWETYTLQNEAARLKLDEYGRVMAQGLDATEPQVSRYLTEKGFRINYPDGKQFAICLTHDIDKTYVGVGRKLFNLFRGRLGGRSFFETISDLKSKNMPNCNFKSIIDLEKNYNAKSTFFLLSLQPNEKDYNYDVASLHNYTSEILDEGFEIGLHGGWEAYKDGEKLAQEKSSLEKGLNRRVVGYRGHYLLFDPKVTWKILEARGFLYDSTFGFYDAIGYRNGLCHPFNPYDFESGKLLNIVEFPFAVMDRTLERYMKLKPKDAWDKIKRVIDASERYGGVITIIWHNSFMWGEWGRLYEKILKYGLERGAWMEGCAEINRIVRDQI